MKAASFFIFLREELIPMIGDEQCCETCRFGSKIRYGQVLCYISYKFESKWHRCPKWNPKEAGFWTIYMEEKKGEE